MAISMHSKQKSSGFELIEHYNVLLGSKISQIDQILPKVFECRKSNFPSRNQKWTYKFFSSVLCIFKGTFRDLQSTKTKILNIFIDFTRSPRKIVSKIQFWKILNFFNSNWIFCKTTLQILYMEGLFYSLDYIDTFRIFRVYNLTFAMTNT